MASLLELVVSIVVEGMLELVGHVAIKWLLRLAGVVAVLAGIGVWLFGDSLPLAGLLIGLGAFLLILTGIRA